MRCDGGGGGAGRREVLHFERQGPVHQAVGSAEDDERVRGCGVSAALAFRLSLRRHVVLPAMSTLATMGLTLMALMGAERATVQPTRRRRVRAATGRRITR